MKRIRIAALGDSLTKGVVLTDRNRYSVLENSFIDMIARKFEADIDNYGRFGCTVGFADRVIARHAQMISSSDYVFLEYGGNDCDFDWGKIADHPLEEHKPKTVLESFKEQFVALIGKIRSFGAVPVIVSLPPIDSESYFDFLSRSMDDLQKRNVLDWLGGDVDIISRWHESYNKELFNIASLTHTHIIDITSPFVDYEGDLKTLYCLDGIHPNAEGHKLIADTISNINF